MQQPEFILMERRTYLLSTKAVHSVNHYLLLDYSYWGTGNITLDLNNVKAKKQQLLF